jgi:thiol:disulfide interchange protein
MACLFALKGGLKRFLPVAGLCLAFLGAAPHVKVDLVSEASSLKTDAVNWVALRFEIEKDWHLYWKNPGDSGEAPRIIWSLPKAVLPGEIQWPTPSRIPVGPLMNFGYSDSLFLMVPLQVVSKNLADATTVIVAAQAKWLVCQESCIPGETSLFLNLPVSRGDSAPTVFADLFVQARAKAPTTISENWKPTASLDENEIVFSWAKAPFVAGTKISFFPDKPNIIENARPQKVLNEGSTLQLRIAKSDQLKGVPQVIAGLLEVDSKAYVVDVPVRPINNEENTPLLAFVLAVLMAFGGGLLLNLMPCVFPVLSIKALSVAENLLKKDQRASRRHAFFYALGVLVSFWALACAILLFRSGTQTLGWGFQLQSPIFVAIVANILFLMALNLLGVFEISGSFMGVGDNLTRRDGYAGSFFTGVLATVVAAPCTAPFMGTALAFALNQPAVIAMIIFTALGLGLAAPYCVISVVPALSKWLPKPGRWMETFKQAMAFPLVGTVIWLVWVFGLETSLDSMTLFLVGFVILAFAVWVFGRWHSARALVFAVAFALLALWVQWPSANATKASPWQEFNRAKYLELTQAGTPVFVDFTAAWCVTCKVNEMVAFTSAVIDEMAARHVVLMRADWTNANADISKTLEEFGRNGVPLYVLFAGGKQSAPIILPQILTPEIVINELKKVHD